MKCRRTWIVMASLALALVLAIPASFGQSPEDWLGIARDVCRLVSSVHGGTFGGEDPCNIIPGNNRDGLFQPGNTRQNPNQQQQILIGEVYVINGQQTQAGIRMTFPRLGAVIVQSTWNYPWEGPYHVQNLVGGQRVIFGYQQNPAAVMELQF